MYYFIVLLLSIVVVNAAIFKSSDTISELYKISVTVKKCLISPDPGICLKERALEALNETMYLEDPIQIGFISIRKNENYHINESLPETWSTNLAEQRSTTFLNDALAEKLQDFFKSRTIQFNVNDALEGKKLDKGGGGGKGGKGMMMMMMAGAAACVGAGMMMGKMGMMAMSALMISKISLLLSVIMLLKKLKGGGGGGGEEKEKIVKVLYAASAGGHDWQTKGGGGGGGGYNSRNYYEPQISAQSMAYRAENPHDVNNGVYQGV